MCSATRMSDHCRQLGSVAVDMKQYTGFVFKSQEGALAVGLPQRIRCGAKALLPHTSRSSSFVETPLH
jgi:hypothetical protein